MLCGFMNLFFVSVMSYHGTLALMSARQTFLLRGLVHYVGPLPSLLCGSHAMQPAVGFYQLNARWRTWATKGQMKLTVTNISEFIPYCRVHLFCLNYSSYDDRYFFFIIVWVIPFNGRLNIIQNKLDTHSQAGRQWPRQVWQDRRTKVKAIGEGVPNVQSKTET